MSVQILQGDCRLVLRTLPESSVDAIVTDPPYHLTNNGGGPNGKGADTPFARAKAGAKSSGFMGMDWDGGDVAFQPATWAEVLRVLKPGGFLLAFGGTRTYHRLACAIEDAGFDLRDMLAWLYGSGFPKGTDKAKIPAEWAGWNTALKPALEPIALARKPMAGTLAENLAAWGTGALNIDRCRIEGEPMPANTGRGAMMRRTPDEVREPRPPSQPHELGRWPANLIHDGSDEVVAGFPAQAGGWDKRVGMPPGTRPGGFGNVGAENGSSKPCGPLYGDTGSAARFFYCAKASRADRNEGCENLPQKAGGMVSNTSGQHITRRDEGYEQKPQGNHHPTVKPTDLMRYLCRLVTPPGGVVLDPFMGSGSTGKAAVLEGFGFVGIEREAEYVEIARQRISSACLPLFAEVAA